LRENATQSTSIRHTFPLKPEGKRFLDWKANAFPPEGDHPAPGRAITPRPERRSPRAGEGDHPAPGLWFGSDIDSPVNLR